MGFSYHGFEGFTWYPVNLIIYFEYKKNKSSYFLDIESILYFTVYGHVIEIICEDGIISYYGKLADIVSLYPDFVYCNRSYVVNKNKIKKVNSSTLLLVDNTEIPLSRTYKRVIKKLLKGLGQNTKFYNFST